MKRNLYEQLKRNMMSDFLRVARQEIISKRPKDKEEEEPPATSAASLSTQLAPIKGSKIKDTTMQMGKSKSSGTTRGDDKKSAAEKKRDEIIEEKQFRGEFTDFLRQKVTEQNAKPKGNIKTNLRANFLRKVICEKIATYKTGGKEEMYDVTKIDTKDIADYIKDVLMESKIHIDPPDAISPTNPNEAF